MDAGLFDDFLFLRLRKHEISLTYKLFLGKSAPRATCGGLFPQIYCATWIIMG